MEDLQKRYKRHYNGFCYPGIILYYRQPEKQTESNINALQRKQGTKANSYLHLKTGKQSHIYV